MNKVLLTGRLTRDPEMRSLASGKNVTTFTVASNEFIGGGKEKAEYHPVVTWDRLAEIAGTYLGKGQQVAIEGRLQTRSWDDDRGARHWKTEVVASHVEMLSGPAQEGLRGPAGRRFARRPGRGARRGAADRADPRAGAGRRPTRTTTDDEEDEAGGRGRLTRSLPRRRRASPPAPPPPCPVAALDELEERHGQDRVDDHQERALEPVRLAVEGDQRADADRGRDRGDLERREDEVHRLADDERRAGPAPGRRTARPGGSSRSVTAIANSILSLAASWTATRCSARLPIVGIRTTPTKNGVSPNDSMNGSIEPTRISDRTASSPAATSSTTIAIRAGPRRAGVALGLAVAAERLGRGS